MVTKSIRFGFGIYHIIFWSLALWRAIICFEVLVIEQGTKCQNGFLINMQWKMKPIKYSKSVSDGRKNSKCHIQNMKSTIWHSLQNDTSKSSDENRIMWVISHTYTRSRTHAHMNQCFKSTANNNTMALSDFFQFNQFIYWIKNSYIYIKKVWPQKWTSGTSSSNNEENNNRKSCINREIAWLILK